MQAIQHVRNISGDHAVIFGGGFNADWDRRLAANFRTSAGLIDVFIRNPDPDPAPGVCVAHRVDYIYYRGQFSVLQTRMRDNYPGASDHPYGFTHLLRTGFVVVPHVTGSYRAQAEERLRAANLQPRFTGSTHQQDGVRSQTPSGGWEVRAGYCGSGNSTP